MNSEETKPARRQDAHDLRNYLASFVSDNQHSSDVEHRWLASYANDLLVQAYNVKAGNHNTIKPLVHAFRLIEIEKAKEKLQGEIDALAKEESKIAREAKEAQEKAA